MGQETSVPIDQFFARPVALGAANTARCAAEKPCTVYVRLATPRRFGGTAFEHMRIHCRHDAIEVSGRALPYSDAIRAADAAAGSVHDAVFDTQMRDSEIVLATDANPRDTEIAHGAGLGVIIIERLCMYVKLYADPVHGVASLERTWSASEGNRGALSTDLCLGYDVLLVDRAGTVHALREPRDAQRGSGAAAAKKTKTGKAPAKRGAGKRVSAAEARRREAEMARAVSAFFAIAARRSQKGAAGEAK
jgi:hypothetical protein